MSFAPPIRFPFSVLAFALTGSVPAIEIQIDYSYDDLDFFDTPGKRRAMEAAASFFEKALHDNLLAIDAGAFGGSASWTALFFHPATGTETEIANLVVPENTLIIFVGSRPLSSGTSGQGGPGGWSASGNQAWFDHIQGRGSAGAASDPPTDVSPWGGQISFNSTVTWNFSLTENLDGREFISTALHEIAHVLGFGTSDVWDERIASGAFSGPAAAQSHGSAPAAGAGHLQNPISGPDLTSTFFGSFGAGHGTRGPALMLPSRTDTGADFDVTTDLDLACLADLGWEVRPPAPLTPLALSPDQASFEWPSVSFFDYRVQRGDDLASFPGGSGLFAGNGLVQSWSDPAPPANRAFYRLSSEFNLASAASASSLTSPKLPAADDSGAFTRKTVAPRVVECGTCAVHGDPE
jgi:hypothetical protein